MATFDLTLCGRFVTYTANNFYIRVSYFKTRCLILVITTVYFLQRLSLTLLHLFMLFYDLCHHHYHMCWSIIVTPNYLTYVSCKELSSGVTNIVSSSQELP